MFTPDFELFKSLCDSQCISPNEVTSKLQISATTLSRWRHNTSFPKYEVVTKIANYFDVPVDAFYLGHNNSSLDLAEYINKALHLMDMLPTITWNGTIMTDAQKDNFRMMYRLLYAANKDDTPQNESKK